MASFDSQGRSKEAYSQSKDRLLFDWLHKNFWGLLTIGLVALLCIIVVKIFKKPGQMTVIEAQSMDMSAITPPAGAVPVAIAKVVPKLVEGSVTYTGTAQAFEDEDIYPRVTGRITRMPVYPGDRVKKGDLLVQLDPTGVSEYKAKLEEAKDEAAAEIHNTGTAKEEFIQKEFEYKAACDEETAAEKVVVDAQAVLAYWTPEIERQRKLYEQQVVSLDELQQEESSYQTSTAKMEKARAQLRAAINKKVAAQAAFNAMTHHVGHQYLLAKKAKAAELNAALYDQYTRIRAKDDAVVTKRVISPGVVVNPGMLILKVAHMDQMRVQTEVSEQDADKIELGDPVFITSSSNPDEVVQAKITSVFPAADITLRTYIMEALVNNIKPVSNSRLLLKPVKTIKQYYFLPGQYVVMRIVTGSSEGPAIPTCAIIWSEGRPQVWKANSAVTSSKHKKYSCLMHPEVVSDQPGKCPKCGMQLQEVQRGGYSVAQLVPIEIGLFNPDLTQVTHGLEEGDEVIYAGYENLSPGMSVVATEWSTQGSGKLPSAGEVSGKSTGMRMPMP